MSSLIQCTLFFNRKQRSFSLLPVEKGSSQTSYRNIESKQTLSDKSFHKQLSFNVSQSVASGFNERKLGLKGDNLNIILLTKYYELWTLIRSC